MYLTSSLLRRHVLESNRIERISVRSGSLYTSHYRAAALVAHRGRWLPPLHPIEIHRTLCRNTPMEEFGGIYRKSGVSVDRNRMPHSSKVPELMEWWWRQVLLVPHVPEHLQANAAMVLHHNFLHIHPFGDGNGRTARLLLNSIRLKCGLPWKIIKRRDRKRYFARIIETETKFRERFPDAYSAATNPA